RDQRHAVRVVHVGEPLDVLVGQAGPGAEVPEVDALGRLASVEGEQPLGVVGPDGAHVRGGAVGEDHVGLVAGRVPLREGCRGGIGDHAAQPTSGFPAPLGARADRASVTGPPSPPEALVRRSLRALVCLILLAGAAACAQEAERDPLAGGRGGGWLGDLDDAEQEVDDDLDAPIAPGTGLDDGVAPDADTVVKAALLDVEDFWERSYAGAYGERYEPISGGFWAYGPGTELPPCGNEP